MKNLTMRKKKGIKTKKSKSNCLKLFIKPI